MKRIALVLVSTLLIGCQGGEASLGEASLVERFPQHWVFAPGEFPEASLSFSNTQDGPTSFLPVRDMDLPDDSLVLVPSSEISPRKTLGNLGENIPLEPLVKKCGWVKIWGAERICRDTVWCIPSFPGPEAQDPIALMMAKLGATPVPEFTAKLTAGRPLPWYYGFDVTLCFLTTVHCEYHCISGDVVCSLLGPYYGPTAIPDSDPDIEYYTSCNTVNPCP